MIKSLNRAIQTLYYPIIPEQSILLKVAPVPKVVFLIIYLILMVSFDRYAWAGTLALALIPFVLMLFGKISPWRIFAKTILAWPFVLCAGIVNCFFDLSTIDWLFGITLRGGVVALFVLIFKTTGTVGMTLLLTTATPLKDISGALAKLHVPRILILQLQFILRYLGVIIEEARNATSAYLLRNPRCKKIHFRDWGILAGRLFLRTFHRANAVDNAMRCRLFSEKSPMPQIKSGTIFQWSNIIMLSILLIAIRYCL